MEELLFQCPYCDARLDPPEEGWSSFCPKCNRQVDLTGQFAYVRGFQAYEEAAEVLDELKKTGRKNRTRYEYERMEQQAYTIFAEAYSALQEAFRYQLSVRQHEHGVLMVSNLTHLFLPRNMISDMEASYWVALMVDQTARKEIAEIQHHLAQKHTWIMHLRWMIRLRQLNTKLKESDIKIRQIQNGMTLAHRLGAYKRRTG